MTVAVQDRFIRGDGMRMPSVISNAIRFVSAASRNRHPSNGRPWWSIISNRIAGISICFGNTKTINRYASGVTTEKRFLKMAGTSGGGSCTVENGTK